MPADLPDVGLPLPLHGLQPQDLTGRLYAGTVHCLRPLGPSLKKLTIVKCFTHSEIIKTNVAANRNYLQPYLSPTSLASRKHLDIVEDHLCLQRHLLSPRLTTIVELVGSLPIFTTQGVFYVQNGFAGLYSSQIQHPSEHILLYLFPH